ncbi:hypothetical protein SEA_MILDRED21_241 [Streptomyces phage Mildred21]|uniref:Uncharacterized protein n=1 Tax=Streptomyces phage Mildred21 TaxID=2023959 RepID=A0A222YWM0_9CAUD|nr:hypothetical protein FDI35_gp079 [Streptomyces phage Mildred21]ASR75599.1 hypothetical protein SEA_MILDRED21_241 [Streptomyces phage Mildred21]
MNIGDKVVLEDDEQAPGDWTGLVCTVIAEPMNLDREEFVRVKPDTDRPDEYGQEWFFWPTSLMNKVD